MRWFIIYLQGNASIVKVKEADRARFLAVYRVHVISSADSEQEVLESPEWQLWLRLEARRLGLSGLQDGSR